LPSEHPSSEVSRSDSVPRRDAIRIVPLYTAGEVAAPAAQLTYRKGPLLTSAEVFTLFWGAAWQEAAQSPLVSRINAFFDFALTSPLVDQLAEYSVAGRIGHGRLTGSTIVPSQTLHTSITDMAIQAFLQREIAQGTLPQATANSLYFLYLPPGTRVVMGGSASCQAFCGYHSDISESVFYAVMPYPGCAGCLGGLTTMDALTSTSSHELCEAITDPVAGQGWYDDANGEIGDICAWKTKKLGQYTVQLEWSNRAGACV